jgi:hypothetical protein
MMTARVACQIGARLGVVVGGVHVGAVADPPTVASVGTFIGGTTDQSPTPPSHVANDVLYLAVQATAAISAPSGWTEIADSPQAQGTSTRLHVFRRVATNGATAAPTVAIGTSNNLYCGIVAIRGADTGTPEDDTAGATSGASGLATITWPRVTTTGQSRLVLLVASYSIDDAGPVSDAYDTTLSNLSTLNDGGTTANNGGGLVIAAGTQGATGLSGVTTCRTIATLYACIAVAVKP